MKQLLLASVLFLSACAAPAIPQETYVPTKPEDMKTYFVQVWTEKAADDMMVLEAEDPGRIEAFEGLDVNNTIACVQFRTVKDWNSDQLANISVGFTYYGNEKNLHFKTYGAASRLVRIQTKITERPKPAVGD